MHACTVTLGACTVGAAPITVKVSRAHLGGVQSTPRRLAIHSIRVLPKLTRVGFAREETLGLVSHAMHSNSSSLRSIRRYVQTPSSER